MSLQGNTYQVDPSLAGARIELIYDAFDLTGPVAVAAAGGVRPGQRSCSRSAGTSTQGCQRRQRRRRGAKNAASGIDYLSLVETRHKTAITGAPISFEKMAAGAGATGTNGGPR